ncbi:thiol reductant ABC exporter subunit CydD [Acidomonas methanolica]|uniref:thiol reductant ABC exporter subunit CydD n=1 Tax=Acidomonas methanolica TaxID=437 RepID=UPI00211A9074|nr:thiol reductant ABC exporter subunit CydD [Acidomonas methanolica]MCQ9155085.1 thiol reductant ABC exporter subunit CydD [Acidomonas methanolica]
MKSADKTLTRAWVRAQSRPARRAASPAVFAGLASTVLGVAQAGLIATALATVLTGGGVSGHLLAALALVLVLRALFGLVQERAAARAGIVARRRLRGSFLRAVVAAGPPLLRRQHSAAVAGTIVDRVDLLDGYFSRWIPAATLATAGPLIVLAGVWWLSPRAVWVFACCGLAVPVGQAVFGIGAARAARGQFLAMMRLQSRFLDRLRGIATVVLANAEEREAVALGQAADDLRRRTMTILRVAFLSSAAIDVAMVAAIVGVVLLYRHDLAAALSGHPGGGHAAGTVASALAALLLAPEFFAPLRAMALAYQDRAQAASTAEAARDLESAVDQGSESPDFGSGVTLVVENVTYAWAADRGPALRDVSFTAGPGDILVLDGPSGAGKSTLVEVLLGFVQPQSGRVLLNGCDLADIAPAALSGAMGWVGQKPVLFAGSLRDNLLFARPDASAEALDHAVRAAAIDRFLPLLPDGLETRVGEGGFGLSGGQAQRIALARAILKDAPLLLLDEPTSHLDPETEAVVIDALRHVARGRTVVLCSHSAALRALGTCRLDLARGVLMEAAA